MRSRDISDNFFQNWGEDKTGEKSGFKGMVVTPDKATAVKWKGKLEGLLA